jgi:hypothetical protein
MFPAKDASRSPWVRRARALASCFAHIWRSGQLPSVQTAKARSGYRVQSLQNGRDRQCRAHLMNIRLHRVVITAHRMGVGCPRVSHLRPGKPQISIEAKPVLAGRPEFAVESPLVRSRANEPWTKGSLWLNLPTWAAPYTSRLRSPRSKRWARG